MTRDVNKRPSANELMNSSSFYKRHVTNIIEDRKQISEEINFLIEKHSDMEIIVNSALLAACYDSLNIRLF